MTTVTFEEHDGSTQLTVREVHPSKHVLDALLASEGSAMDAMPETLDQLDELLGARA